MNGSDEDVLSELSDLIETLTTSGNRTLDEKLFKRVKSICKCSDDNVRHLYRLVMTQLEKRHSEIRLSALQIINEIFTRSHAFRELLVDDLQKLFTLTIGVNSKKPLPGPSTVASTLRNQAFEAIESWHQKYGVHYMKLALGYKYLKRVKKFNFDNSQSRTELERQRAEDIETRRANLAEQKLSTVLTQMGDSVSEIQNIITEMGNCFRLVLPSPDDFDIYTENSEKQTTTKLLNGEEPSTNLGITDDPKPNDMKSSCSHDNLNDHGLSSQQYQLNIPLTMTIEIIKTPDNNDVLNMLCELDKQVVNKYLPLTQKWLEVLTKHSGHHENLVQAIDLKNSLTELKYKFDKLQIATKDDKNASSRKSGEKFNNKDGQSAEDDFIDVPEKEGLEHVPENRRHEYGLESVENNSSYVSKSKKGENINQTSDHMIGWNPHGNQSTLGDPSSRATAIAKLLDKHEKKLKINRKSSHNSSSCTITRPVIEQNEDENFKADTSSSEPTSETNEKRAELLKRAPVIPFGMDLYNWERKQDEAPSVLNLKSLHCYWAHPNEDNDDHCPGDIKESMKSRSIPFAGEFQEIKWSCRAPLPNGKLCPRKDKYKCPFHGKIIPRDAMGRPAESDDSDTEDTARLRSRELDVVTRDVELATGLDLGSKKEKRGKKRKHSGLTDLKKKSNSSRARLEKIVFNKAALARVAEETDKIRKSLVDEKFGNNWNYSLKESY